MGYTSAVGEFLVAMLGAVTLLPAFFGFAGSKINRASQRGSRRSEAEVAAHTTLYAAGIRANHVGRNPFLDAIGQAFVVLTAVAAPVLTMRTRHGRRRHHGE